MPSSDSSNLVRYLYTYKKHVTLLKLFNGTTKLTNLLKKKKKKKKKKEKKKEKSPRFL